MDLKVEWNGVDCIYLTKVRDKWQAVVNKVMNLRVPLYMGFLYQLRKYEPLKKDFAPWS